MGLRTIHAPPRLHQAGHGRSAGSIADGTNQPSIDAGPDRGARLTISVATEIAVLDIVKSVLPDGTKRRVGMLNSSRFKGQVFEHRLITLTNGAFSSRGASVRESAPKLLGR